MECSHEACTCVVAGDEEFCGDVCRSHVTSDEVASSACFCGHPECGGSVEGTPPTSTGPLR